MTLDWEARWRKGDTPWDRGAPAPPLLDWLAGQSGLGDVLVPGCGRGHEVRALATAGARPLGLDVAAPAIAAAEAAPRVATERYRVGDLLRLPSDLAGSFDWVVEHTCFCAIPPARRTEYPRAVHAALRPGGHVFAIFFLDPGVDQGPPWGITRAELDALFEPLFELLEDFVPATAFPGREGRECVRVLRRR